MALRTLTKWLLGVAFALGMTSLQTNSAQAHIFGHGSCGSSGGWGSCGSSGGWGSCGSSGGWGWHHGSSGGWGSCGSSGGSWGSYGSWGSCGSSGGSWGSSGGSWGSSGGSWSTPSYSVPMDSAPMMSPPGSSMPVPTTAPPAPGKSALDMNSDTGYLVVDVPADAKVFVNGRATTSTGEHRQYVSHGLEAGMRYEYQVRAEIIRDGKVVSETKTVQLAAGAQADVAFEMPASSPAAHTAKTGAAPRTAVLLHVPADAKVYLAGMEMKSTGPDREFATTKLAEGSAWDHYTVRVVSGGDSREQTLTLLAGDSRELTFNFDTTKVASATR